MTIIPPSPFEAQTLEQLRLKLIAAKQPDAFLTNLPLMLGHAAHAQPSRRVLDSSLEPALEAAGYAIEAIRIFKSRAAQPGRPEQVNYFPTGKGLAEDLSQNLQQAKPDELDAYRLDKANRFILLHTKASMGSMLDCEDRYCIEEQNETLATDNADAVGSFYTVKVAHEFLTPEIARLQKLNGEETYDLLSSHRPFFKAAAKDQPKPTRQ